MTFSIHLLSPSCAGRCDDEARRIRHIVFVEWWPTLNHGLPRFLSTSTKWWHRSIFTNHTPNKLRTFPPPHAATLPAKYYNLKLNSRRWTASLFDWTSPTPRLPVARVILSTPRSTAQGVTSNLLLFPSRSSGWDRYGLFVEPRMSAGAK